MNLEQICEKFILGKLLSEPVLQVGGSLHRNWCVQTDKGKYSVKCIDQKNIALLGDRLVEIKHFLNVAKQCKFPVKELRFSDDQLWLIGEWIEGECLQKITISQAKKIGSLVKNIHATNANLDALKPWWGAVDLKKWRQTLPENFLKWSGVERWNELAEKHAATFQNDLVISHRDISTSNIVWTKDDEPVLIDWEFSGWINRELEIFITALNFNAFESEGYHAVIEAYGQPLQCDVTTLLGGYVGYGLDWMDFNVDRIIHYPEQTDISLEQIRMSYHQLLSSLRCCYSSFSHP